MKFLVQLASAYSKRHREKRGRLFRQFMHPQEDDRILDLGGGDGSHVAAILPFRKNVVIADVSADALRRAGEVNDPAAAPRRPDRGAELRSSALLVRREAATDQVTGGDCARWPFARKRARGPRARASAPRSWQ